MANVKHCIEMLIFCQVLPYSENYKQTNKENWSLFMNLMYTEAGCC